MKMNKLNTTLIRKLQQLEQSSHKLTHEIHQMRNLIEFPYIAEEVSAVLKKKKGFEVSTSWLQRKYSMGYARAALLKDLLEKAK